MTENVTERAHVEENAEQPQVPTTSNSPLSRRRVQKVLTTAQKYKIANWMTFQEKKEASKIPSKAVPHFTYCISL